MEPDLQSYSLNNPLTTSVINCESYVMEVKKVPLLHRNTQPQGYSLSQEARKYLSFLRGRCYVISVSGKPVVGKSTLLNILVSLFKMTIFQAMIIYHEIYPVGDRKKSTTQDVDMFCFSVKGKNFIFLDVEGDGDPRREDAGSWIYANLLQTAVGVSHVHIYNFQGIPQKDLLNDFEVISKVVKYYRIHDHFQTKFVLLVRDHLIESTDMIAEELEEFKASNETILGQSGIDYSMHLLPRPPEHILFKNSQRSCIKQTGILCEGCRSDLFISILHDLSNQLNQHLGEVPPFKDGDHLIIALEHLLEINRRELPYYPGGGHISERRSKKFQNEKIRVQDGLIAVEQCQAQNGFYKQVEKVMNDHPKLANQELIQNLEKTIKNLEKNISQGEYMIQELSTLTHQYLVNDRNSILDEKEKDILWDIYISRFVEFTEEVIVSSNEYEETIEKVCEILLEIKNHVTTNLKEYVIAASEARARAVTMGVDLVSSAALGIVGREIAGKAVALVFGVGGVAGAIITAYFFVQAYQELNRANIENERALNRRTIDGIHSIKDAEEQLEKVEKFLTKRVNDLEANRQTLRKVCEVSAKENLVLIERISNAMENRVKGINLTVEDRNQLMQLIDVVRDNIQRSKVCL